MHTEDKSAMSPILTGHSHIMNICSEAEIPMQWYWLQHGNWSTESPKPSESQVSLGRLSSQHRNNINHHIQTISKYRVMLSGHNNLITIMNSHIKCPNGIKKLQWHYCKCSQLKATSRPCQLDFPSKNGEGDTRVLAYKLWNEKQH